MDCFVLKQLIFFIDIQDDKSQKSAKKNRKKEQNEAPIAPTKIGMVLEQFCTMEKFTVHPTMLPFFTPCQVTDGEKLKAFIAPVNHNNL